MLCGSRRSSYHPTAPITLLVQNRIGNYSADLDSKHGTESHLGDPTLLRATPPYSASEMYSARLGVAHVVNGLGLKETFVTAMSRNAISAVCVGVFPPPQILQNGSTGKPHRDGCGGDRGGCMFTQDRKLLRRSWPEIFGCMVLQHPPHQQNIALQHFF